jgi:transposase
VTAAQFKNSTFFDPNDLVQVKYEMVRCVQHEGNSISESARNFGFSRPAFYEAQEALKKDGITGLIPKKTGPKTRHKITAEIMEFLHEAIESHKITTSVDLAKVVLSRFSISVHPRSIERALADEKKKEK